MIVSLFIAATWTAIKPVRMKYAEESYRNIVQL